MHKEYIILSKYYMIHEGSLHPASLSFVRDISKLHKSYNPNEDLNKYIEDASDIFIEKTKKCMSLETNITSLEEHKLRLMLESLINAKRLWQEENSRQNDITPTF